jgi:hypothetical protein
VLSLPEEVQTYIAIARSLTQLEQGTGKLPCGNPTCGIHDNQPRTANKICERSPPYCAQCCRSHGGCRIHKGGSGGGSSSSPGSGSALIQTPAVAVSGVRTKFSRALSADYGSAWRRAIQTSADAEARLSDEREGAGTLINMVQVVLYFEVSLQTYSSSISV